MFYRAHPSLAFPTPSSSAGSSGALDSPRSPSTLLETLLPPKNIARPQPESLRASTATPHSPGRPRSTGSPAPPPPHASPASDPTRSPAAQATELLLASFCPHPVLLLPVLSRPSRLPLQLAPTPTPAMAFRKSLSLSKDQRRPLLSSPT